MNVISTTIVEQKTQTVRSFLQGTVALESKGVHYDWVNYFLEFCEDLLV
jgi:hypothetical protein